MNDITLRTILAIFFLIGILLIGFYFGVKSIPSNASAWDEGWHIGVNQCSNYYNLTDDERIILNQYRAEKLREEKK